MNKLQKSKNTQYTDNSMNEKKTLRRQEYVWTWFAFLLHRYKRLVPYELYPFLRWYIVLSFLVSFSIATLALNMIFAPPTYHIGENVKKIAKESFTQKIASFFLPQSKCWTCEEPVPFDAFTLAQLIHAADTSITLVDIRSKQEYDAGHIKTAINIPVYTDVTHIVASEVPSSSLSSTFQKIYKANKLLVLYDNSNASSLDEATVSKLSSDHIKAVVLSVGWNEWVHLKNLWVPEKEWNSFIPEDYIELEK